MPVARAHELRLGAVFLPVWLKPPHSRWISRHRQRDIGAVDGERVEEQAGGLARSRDNRPSLVRASCEGSVRCLTRRVRAIPLMNTVWVSAADHHTKRSR